MPLTERTIETSFDRRHRRRTILAALVPIQFLEQLVNGRADVLCGVATTFRYRADDVSDHLEYALGIELNNLADNGDCRSAVYRTPRIGGFASISCARWGTAATHSGL